MSASNSHLQRIAVRLGRSWLLSRKRVLHYARPVPYPARSRLFIAGMQRSGTNMLMNVLEKSMETDVYHERDSRAFVNYQMRSVIEIESLIKRSSAHICVIKALCELQDLSVLMNRLSPAKTVWIVRQYDDVVNSMLRSFGNMAKQVLRIVDNRDSSGWIGRGMSDETHAVLKDMVSDSLDDATASALQWYLRNMLFFDQSFDADRRVMLVGYEKLASNPVDEFARIFNFIGIDFSTGLAGMVTPRSIGKNPPSQIDPAVRTLCDDLYDRFHALLDGQQ